ncbi:MAG: FkbM family methyltransferase [Hyphomicrobium sp.]
MTLIDEAAFPVEIPYIETYEDICLHREKYLSEYLNYADARSRVILDALLLYRLTLDSTCVQGHFEPESEQYFDRDLARMSRSEVFVDAGGFDGATTLNFMQRVGGDYSRVYYFEPDPALMTRSRQAMAAKPNVVYCEAGAYSRDGTVTFNTTGTTNGAISDAAGATGDLTISVRRIDGLLTEPASFIKMDIEGAEFEALKGAREQIARNAPLLAIAAYHKGEDLWRLGELIRDLNPNYRLGLRHYTEGGLESVLYAYRADDRAS